MQIKREHLRNARRARGWTALELAEQIGVSENQVYFTERGRTKPKQDAALRWSAALGMNPEQAFPELFSGG